MYTPVLVRMYMRGPSDVCLQIVHKRTLGTTRTYATFQNTPWIINGCMLQPLDHCINSTRRTLGLPDVCYFSGELVAPLIYKYPLPSSLSHAHFHCSRRLQVASTLVCMFCQVCDLLHDQRGSS